MTKRKKIPKPDHDAAIRVLVGSKEVVKWAEGEARSYDVNLNTPEGKAFFDRACRQRAEVMIKQA